jgi:hypothetical protein
LSFEDDPVRLRREYRLYIDAHRGKGVRGFEGGRNSIIKKLVIKYAIKPNIGRPSPGKFPESLDPPGTRAKI